MYVSFKEDPNKERCEDNKDLILHISKNDSHIIGSRCSHHIIGQTH